MERNFTVALAGNPNSGKTTAFNGLTGSHQHVVNYPGVTVEKKIGHTKLGERRIDLIDLPGTYSLTAYSPEELVARRVLAEDKPDVVITVLNSVALERNLYLALQIMELGLPVTLALNMIDEAREQGMTIDKKKLSELIGAPVVETVARKGEGLGEVLGAAVKFGELRKKGEVSPIVISYGPDLDPALAKFSERITQANFLTENYPARWVALKYLENDEEIHRLGKEKNPELHAWLHKEVADIAKHLQTTLGTFPEAVISDYRYGFIASLMREGIVQRQVDNAERVARSDKIDRVLTNQLLGPLILLGVLYLIYQITFSLGEYPMGWVEDLFAWMGDVASNNMPDGLLKSMVVDGIIAGVGGVLVFVPLIMITFFLIAIMEDSGYMARIAYMLDRVFRIFGLHGCSVMPFIVSGGIAGGCAVPGVMASRTLRSPREKLATLLTAPFMACGAKLPVFLLIVGTFFASHKTLVMFLITILGWVVALVVARVLRSTIISGPATPFVMELPPYRLPTLFGLIIHTLERTWEYVKRAVTILLAVSILLWAAMTFPQLPEEEQGRLDSNKETIEVALAAAEAAEPKDEAVIEKLQNDLEFADEAAASAGLTHTLAGRLGKSLEPVTHLAGFSWKTNIALIGGTAAKEVIVSTLGTAYAIEDAGDEDSEGTRSLSERLANDPDWNIASALSLIVFVLIYAPCVVTLIVIRQETSSWGWTFFSLFFNTGLAYGLAVLTYQVASRIIT